MASNRQFKCGVGLSRPSNRKLRCEALEDRRLLALVIVDTIDDVIDFSDGKTSLREAIFATNTVPGADEIRFNFGESLPAMILLKQGELKITDALTVFGPGPDLLTIDASGNDPTPTLDNGDGSRAFNIEDDESTSHFHVTIAGMTITGGDASSRGGGIRSRESLQVINVHLIDNAANNGAGAIEIVTTWPANISLESSFIVNNRGWGSGGGILVALSTNSHLSVTDCTISGNRSSQTVADGGGMRIYTSGHVNVTLSRNVISDNRTSGTGGDGGGLHLRGNGGGALSMTNNQFLKNSTNGTGAEGGGAFLSWRGNATIEGNHFELNSTDGTGAEGGGLNISGGGGALSINRNQFFKNSTDGTGAEGGGCYVSWSTDATITENAFFANSTDGTIAKGGGLYAEAIGSDNLLIHDNEFRDNSTMGTSAGGGGAAVVKSGGGAAYFYNNIVVSNRIQGTFPIGLGVHVAASAGGTINLYANQVLRNASILEQQNRGFAGIGGESLSGGRIFIERNTVSDNFGGISTRGVGYIEVNKNIVSGNSRSGMSLESSGEGRVEVNENIVTNNSTGGISLSVTKGGVIHSRKNTVIGNGSKAIQSGGGVSLGAQSGGIINFEEGVVEGNSALGGYGGISAFLRSGGVIQVRSTTVADNHSLLYLYSTDGGGVRVDNRGGIFTLEQSTITGNSSIGSGGGISLGGRNEGQFPSVFIIRHCTIAENIADADNDGVGSGGGLHISSGELYLDHSIAALNADKSARAPDISGNVTEARFNLIGDNATSSLAEAPVGFPDANGNMIGGPIHGPIDPLLGTLTENGGPTRTLALLLGSPAIDAGSAELTPGLAAVSEFDQRGAPFTRLAGSRIDIGAFERQSPEGALDADFDFDGRVSGVDFLTWQRNFGRANPTFRHGDATADGDVDANDLGVWISRFGESSNQDDEIGVDSTESVSRQNFLSSPLKTHPVHKQLSLATSLVVATNLTRVTQRDAIRSGIPCAEVSKLKLTNAHAPIPATAFTVGAATGITASSTRQQSVYQQSTKANDDCLTAADRAFADWSMDASTWKYTL